MERERDYMMKMEEAIVGEPRADLRSCPTKTKKMRNNPENGILGIYRWLRSNGHFDGVGFS